MSMSDENFVAAYKLPKSELDKIHLGYCTPSAGAHDDHTLPLKLQAIAAAGFTQVEMGFPDLVSYAKSQLGDAFGGEKDFDSLEQVAKSVRQKCEELGLYVCTIMPFGAYGGYTKESDRKEALERAEGWFRIIQALGNPMLQCGTTDEPDSSEDIQEHIKDLETLADMAATRNPPIKIAYEQWCWGKKWNTWQHSWQVVKAANRQNLGLCLDTFQITGIDWADPTSKSGLNESVQDQEANLKASLKQLVDEVPADKIFYLQISSASRMDPPLGPGHPAWSTEKPPRGLWSDSFRPMPFNPERKSYLPVMPVVQAILQTGFRGIFSVETFDMGKMEEEGEKIPAQLTGSAIIILKDKILKAFEQ